MSKWEMVRLGDVCDINMGQSPESTSYNGKGIGLPFYQGNADFGLLYPVVRYWCNSPKKLAHKDDLLISVRAPIGALNVATEKCCIGRGLASISAKKQMSDLTYIYYLLKNKHRELNGKGTGSTFKAINKNVLLELSFPLPPLEEQKKIASVLDKASELIELRKKQIAKLDLLVKARFVEMFGDPVENPMGWEARRLGDSISVLTDYHANGGYETLAQNVSLLDEPNYALMIRTTDLEKNNFIQDVKYITKEAYEFLDKSKVFGGEIIINKIGSAGKVYLMPYLNRPVSLAMNQFLLRFNKNTSVIYIYYYLKTGGAKKEINQRVRGAVTKTITKDAVRDIPLINPPLEPQNQFADFVAQVEKQKETIQKGLSKLEMQYKALMQQYFE